MAPSSDPREHPWWQHLPHSQRQARLHTSRRLRLQQKLGQRSTVILAALLVYAATCLLFLLSKAGSLTALALTPALVLPLLAALAWWLTWKEFHH